MNIFNTMERTLQVGSPKTGVGGGSGGKKIKWSRGFREPVDAALHIGTPRPTISPSLIVPDSKEMRSFFQAY